MAQHSQILYFVQYLGFCDGARRTERDCLRQAKAVTETFLHETAVSDLSYGDLTVPSPPGEATARCLYSRLDIGGGVLLRSNPEL